MASKGRKTAKSLPVVLPDGTVDVLPASEREKLSLITSAAKLQVDGLSPAEIAHALDVTVHRVKTAQKDPRMRIALLRARAVAAGDVSAADVLDLARADYRVARAWEVIDSGMDGADPWLRFQSAQAVLAAASRAGSDGSATEVVLVSDLLFDDQDLQDDAQDGADMPELTVIDAD